MSTASNGFNFSNLGSLISTLGSTAGTIISATHNPTPTSTAAPVSQTTPVTVNPATGVSTWFSNPGNLAVIGLGAAALVIMLMMLKKK